MLEIGLLGTFRVAWDGRPVDAFATDKVRALLAYLAAEAPAAQRRTHLAALLWGDWDDSGARSNLRKALFWLRQTLDAVEAGLADRLLIITRATVQLDPTLVRVDVGEFETLLQAAFEPARAQQAAALYRGDLLAGLTPADAPEFEEWMLVRREGLHQQALDLLHRLAVALIAQGAYAEAQPYVLQQLALERWREQAHRQMMRLLWAQGQREQALAQFEKCRVALEEELGITPAAETEQLRRQIAADEPAQRHGFPTPATPFFGRAQTVRALAARLASPDSRLITVIGAGGSGKTRLAVQTAAQLPVAAGDAYFVPLEAVTDGHVLVMTIAEQVGVTFSRDTPPADQLLHWLAARRVLLVLDNYEQLLPDTRFVERIINEAPTTRLLVTSRVPLNLRAEWRLPLDGLETPAEPGRADGAHGAQAIADFPAVQLLLTTGQRVQPGLTITPDNAADLVRICRALAGMPLALEMAGSWLALFTPRLLAEQIDRNLDFLVATQRDIPERHRSLRAIFDHALAQLAPDVRAALGQLTCFQDSFTLPAALGVTSATFGAISTLLDYALLQRRDDDRYSLHPVLRLFAREQLPNAAEVQQRHARYYLHEVAAAARPAVAQTVGAIGRDVANVRTAWQWAVVQRDADLLATALDGLLAYYEFRGTYAEGRAQFAAAAAVLPPSELVNRLRLAEATCHQKLGDLVAAVALVEQVASGVARSDGAGDEQTRLTALIALGRLHEMRGDYDAAVETLRAALASADVQSPAAAQIWNTLGSVYRYRGATDESIAAHKQALTLSLALRAELQAGENHANLSLVYKDIGAYGQAIEHIEQALAIAVRLDHRENIARFTQNLGLLYWQQDRLDEARNCYESALAMAEELRHKRGIAMCTGGLGVLARRRREYDVALPHLRRALRLAVELGDRAMQATVLGNMGNVYLDTGQYRQARAHYERALALDRATGVWSGVARHLGNMGDSLREQQRYAEALPHFEEAIPYLRQSAAYYYLCWVLVSYGDCLFALGRLAEAQTACAEAQHLAETYEREPYKTHSGVLAARLTAAGGDRPAAIAQLHAMQAVRTDPEQLAEIDYALWRISGDPAVRAVAQARFAVLSEQTHVARYRAIAAELAQAAAA